VSLLVLWYLLTYLLTELSPSWGAVNCAAPQEPPSILCYGPFSKSNNMIKYYSIYFSKFKPCNNISNLNLVLKYCPIWIQITLFFGSTHKITFYMFTEFLIYWFKHQAGKLYPTDSLSTTLWRRRVDCKFVSTHSDVSTLVLLNRSSITTLSCNRANESVF
jgi:hypothetical protein